MKKLCRFVSSCKEVNSRREGYFMTSQTRSLNFTRPIVLAPMAGGPSTPRLAAAVAEAGGVPFLAAGYLSPDKLRENILELESQTSASFGVNLFSPNLRGRNCALDVYRFYRDRVIEVTGAEEALLPQDPFWSDDAVDDKLEVVLDSAACFVSFIFVYPSTEVIERIHAAGKLAVLYATSRPGLMPSQHQWRM